MVEGLNITDDSPFLEYPRPQLERENYTILNGTWECQVKNRNQTLSDKWEKILVPYPYGSKLSNQEGILEDTKDLWYRKLFKYTKKDIKTFLNFEAVDQVAYVYLNGAYIGKHEGGYSSFSFDVSDIIQADNELLVRVNDYSDRGIFAYGKQSISKKIGLQKASGGIWQSVWLEDHGENYIENIYYDCDFENKKIKINIQGKFSQAIVTINEKDKEISRAIISEPYYEYTFTNMQEWSPDNPFLYSLYIETEDDLVKSYFGMRKLEYRKDMSKLYINDKPIFLSGILNQAYYKEGLYTPINDQILIKDIQTIKDMGFNMIVMHEKIDSKRFYYHCDKLGILVMQDMPRGTSIRQGFINKLLNSLNKQNKRSEASKKVYYKELNDLVLNLYNNPSVFAYTCFNGGWGQFSLNNIISFIKEIDTTRLINASNGYRDEGLGDFNFNKIKPEKINLVRLTNYKNLIKNLDKKLLSLLRRQVISRIREGIGGYILYQYRDMEDEKNGLLTFDENLPKVKKNKLRAINLRMQRGVKDE